MLDLLLKSVIKVDLLFKYLYFKKSIRFIQNLIILKINTKTFT